MQTRDGTVDAPRYHDEANAKYPRAQEALTRLQLLSPAQLKMPGAIALVKDHRLAASRKLQRHPNRQQGGLAGRRASERPDPG